VDYIYLWPLYGVWPVKYTIIGEPYIEKGRKLMDYRCPSCLGTFTTRYERLADEKATGMCKACAYTVRSSGGHGLSGHRLYNIWDHIVQRTTNQKSDNYPNYGGRGIKMLEQWRLDFLSFYNWAMDNGYAEHLTIDRIDVDGDYTPSNCRWADTFTQSQNTRLLRKNNTSGYRGVTRSHNKWSAEITANGVALKLGRYSTPEEAAKAFDSYVLENGLQHPRNFDE
jgi:hypothetical protein